MQRPNLRWLPRGAEVAARAWHTFPSEICTIGDRKTLLLLLLLLLAGWLASWLAGWLAGCAGCAGWLVGWGSTVCPVGFLRVGEGTLATYEIGVFGAVGASSCFCQKEYHEECWKCPNTAKSKDSGPSGPLLVFVRRSNMRRAGSAQRLQKARVLWPSGARDRRQPMVPSRQGPDLAWNPFPGPSLSPGNLQTRPTGPNRTVSGRARAGSGWRGS